MDKQATDQPAGDAGTAPATTAYGTARMQQMSGGTTPRAADNDATDGAYGASRIAQMHGVGVVDGAAIQANQEDAQANQETAPANQGDLPANQETQ